MSATYTQFCAYQRKGRDMSVTTQTVHPDAMRACGGWLDLGPYCGVCDRCKREGYGPRDVKQGQEKHGDPRFYKLLDEIADLHSRKNHDYSKSDAPLSNFTRSVELGVEPWRGVLIRMSDKWSRIEQLANGKTPKNESMRDSLIDLAVYALIDVLLLEDKA